MVVQVVPPAAPEAPSLPAHKNGSARTAHRVLELVGEAQQLEAADGPQELTALSPDETLRALRLLALDNLVDIVHLRESVATQTTRIESLESEVAMWRERAIAEGDARQMESQAAHRRERDLISVLHHQMLTVQAMNEELDRKWHRRWRRRVRAA